MKQKYVSTLLAGLLIFLHLQHFTSNTGEIPNKFRHNSAKYSHYIMSWVTQTGEIGPRPETL